MGGGSRGDGSPDSPIADLQTALDTVADGTLLIMKAGSTHSFPATGGYATLNKPIKLTGHQVTITAQ